MSSSRRDNVICLAGLTACGKSTAARQLASSYDLRYVSGGTALKELALKMGYKAEDRGWWETPGGMRFLDQRLHETSFDKRIDDQLLEYAEQGNVVLDSWTMPWLCKRGFKVWFEVSLEERTRRLAKRDGISIREAAAVIAEKDGTSKQIYERLYGFKLGEDFSPFDLILDTEMLSAEEAFETLTLVINRLVLKSR